jgi:hypothetical protein
MDTYELKDDLSMFYARMLPALFYIDESAKRTVIFMDYCDIKRIHALQMMIPKYLPWLFADNPLTPEEAMLLKSLGNKKADEYERLIEQFAKMFDVRSEMIKTRLDGFENVYEKIKINEIRQSIEIQEKEYQQCLISIRNVLNTIQEKQIYLAGLECKINESSGSGSEIMEYFLCNKNLSVISVNGTQIEFVVHGYADIFDEEAADRYISNKSGFL